MTGKINVINITKEDKSSSPHYYYIGRSKEGNVLGNPFTFNGKHTSLAKLSFKTREEAIKAYEKYFDFMYGNDETFTKMIDTIYEDYKAGNEVYLGCFCSPLPCHGNVIADKLQKRLIKEYKRKKG
jgi:hypothetical protein